MNDNKNINPAAEQLVNLVMSLLEQSFGQTSSTPATSVTISQEKYADIQAKLRSITDLQSKLHVAEERIKAYETEQKSMMTRNDDLNAFNRRLQHQLANAERQLREAKSPVNQKAEYNKLAKHYKACQNQRDSYISLVAAKEHVIDELRSTIDELRRAPQNSVPVLIIDGVPYSASDVGQVIKVSNERAVDNERLLRDLTNMTKMRDQAIGNAEELLKQRDELKATALDACKQRDEATARIKVWTLHGQVLSDERIKELADLGLHAERAGITIPMTEMMMTVPKCGTVTQQAEPDPAYANPEASMAKPQVGVVYEHRHLASGMKDLIRIFDPENVRLSIQVDKNRMLEVDATLVQKMMDDLAAMSARAGHFEEMHKGAAEAERRANQVVAAKEQRISALTRTVTGQAASLNSANNEIARLRTLIAKKDELIAEKGKYINQLTTERNLLRGRANQAQARAKQAEETFRVNGTTLESGQSYMTTSLGILPIDANGMRKLSDALDSYRSRLADLTKRLEDWAKT